MRQWLLKLLGSPVEFVDNTCRACQILEQQLAHERLINKELIDTITSLIKPKEITQTVREAPNVLIQRPTVGSLSRRRAEYERVDRLRAQQAHGIVQPAKSDEEIKASSTEELESELGINNAEEDKAVKEQQG